MRILFIASTGASDSTRASIPLHIAVNGSVVEGQECAIALVGDGAELISRENAETLEGVGIPPVRELLAKVREHQIPVYV